MMHFTDRAAAPLPLDPAIALLGNEPEGLAMDFCAMRGFIRDRSTPANNWLGNPDAKLNHVSPVTKWLTDRHGNPSSGTALRCNHDPLTLDGSTTTAHSLVGSKTLTIAGSKTYAVGQIVSVSLAADITKYMLGRVTGWNGGTKALTIAVYASSGYFSGSDWRVIVALGLSVEGQRTNLLINSTFAGIAPGPDYSFSSSRATGSKVTFTVASPSRSYSGWSFAVAANTTYTASALVDTSVSISFNQVFVFLASLPAGATVAYYANGVLWPNVGASLPAGSYILHAVLTIGGTAGSAALRAGAGTSGPTAADMVVTVDMPMFEAGIGSRLSYIPTTVAAVTRAADNIYLATSEFRFSTAAMTLFADVVGSTPGTFAASFGINTAALRNGNSGSGGPVSAYIRFGGIINDVLSAVTASGFRAAARIVSGSSALSVNGGAVATGAGTFTIASGANGLQFGQANAGGTHIGGHLRAIVHLPRGAANSELQARSA